MEVGLDVVEVQVQVQVEVQAEIVTDGMVEELEGCEGPEGVVPG